MVSSTDTRGWSIHPVAGPISEVVLDDGLAWKLSLLPQLDYEVAGFLYGIVVESSLVLAYGDGHSIGTRTLSEMMSHYATLHNVLVAKAREFNPDLVTVLYHSHPRLRKCDLSKEEVGDIETALDLGYFDYLREAGIKPTFQDAIGEISRQLTEEDHRSIFGDATILLTNTPNARDKFCNFNAYVRGDGEMFTRVQIVSLETKSTDLLSSVRELEQRMYVVHESIVTDLDVFPLR